MFDPVTTLYWSLLLTSTTAAMAAREMRHDALTRVYMLNGVIYGLLGVFHLLGL